MKPILLSSGRVAACAAALGALALAALPVHAQTQAQTQVQTQAQAAKKKITSADQLPRRTYLLPKLPSELVGGPIAELMPLADAIEKDTRADLVAFEIEDKATLRGMVALLSSIAMLRGQWSDVPAHTAQLRELQDKPAGRATAGVISEVIAQTKAGGGDAAAQSQRVAAALKERYGAMKWADVQDAVKGTRGQFELLNPALVVPAFKEQADALAKNAGMNVPGGVVAGILSSRAQVDAVAPFKAAVVDALTAVINANAGAAKPDLWSQRLVALPGGAKGKPIAVGVWDSGVDLALFKPASGKGIAFDMRNGKQSDDLLRDLGEAKPRWPQMKQLVRGSMDLRAALDTEQARQLKQKIATLKPEELKQFQEDMAAASLYTHGTHVAGIAVDGNPFAQVFAASMHWDHTTVPTKPNEELSKRTAEAYRKIVDQFKASGVRVVNMSWRYGAAAYEDALAYHGIGKDGEDRKQIARKLFAIERDALKAAFESAPDILFVAGSGNEDNSADFAEYIPAGFSLPNLITAGAVDKAGEETSFSTFGKTVVVHANGFEVESYLPGGDRVKFSGTSMAAPQVTNLAAKLFALKPELSVAQVKELILSGAERNGRVNLIHPKKTLALAGLNISP
jgi:subtilisin family serine protease